MQWHTLAAAGVAAFLISMLKKKLNFVLNLTELNAFWMLWLSLTKNSELAFKPDRHKKFLMATKWSPYGKHEKFLPFDRHMHTIWLSWKFCFDNEVYFFYTNLEWEDFLTTSSEGSSTSYGKLKSKQGVETSEFSWDFLKFLQVSMPWVKIY